MKEYHIASAIEVFIAKHKLPPECREDMLLALQDVLPLCESQEDEDNKLADWLEQRPHLLAAENVQIPDAELEPAFGDEPSLEARGVLIRKYGRGAYDRFRDLWKATDSTLSPGTNPNAAAQRKSGAAGKSGSDEPDVSPSRNPWHPAFRGDKNAAIASVIKMMGSAGAVRMARAAKTPDAPHGRTLSGQPLRK